MSRFNWSCEIDVLPRGSHLRFSQGKAKWLIIKAIWVFVSKAWNGNFSNLANRKFLKFCQRLGQAVIVSGNVGHYIFLPMFPYLHTGNYNLAARWQFTNHEIFKKSFANI